MHLSWWEVWVGLVLDEDLGGVFVTIITILSLKILENLHYYYFIIKRFALD